MRSCKTRVMKRAKRGPIVQGASKRGHRTYPTANAKMIGELMKAKKVRGNFKDYVIIVGDRLIDWDGSYQIRFEGEDADKKPSGLALLHKRVLDMYIGPELAKQFWNSKTKTRKVKEGTKPKGATDV